MQQGPQCIFEEERPHKRPQLMYKTIHIRNNINYG